MLIDRLISGIIEKEAPIVVGLDPRPNQIPEQIILRAKANNENPVEAMAEAIWLFNKGLIDAIHLAVPAVKPQIAFYEALGIPGLVAYKKTCDYAKASGMVVIADAKRGDIGTTSKAYADAFIGTTDVWGNVYEAFPSDFVTVNPYLGTDCLKEFADNMDLYDKGMFILVKTSNKSSGELQDLQIDGTRLYERVAGIVEALSSSRVGKFGYSGVGSVVGATYPEQGEELRSILKTSFFLVPGYGAQGGRGKDIIGCFDSKGLGAIVNSSRGITFAFEQAHYQNDYQLAAVQAVEDMKKDINDALKAAGKWYT
jgi:orotidine-5'-phosphate decarboxylase